MNKMEVGKISLDYSFQDTITSLNSPGLAAISFIRTSPLLLQGGRGAPLLIGT
jgi:hypothetical protein